jgi:hypothetical protein
MTMTIISAVFEVILLYRINPSILEVIMQLLFTMLWDEASESIYIDNRFSQICVVSPS